MTQMQELTGKEYLMAEIACKHDKSMEKETWDTRIAHFNSMDLNDPKIFKKASDPIGLRAAAIAYDKALGGVASGYTISLDACSSGLQLLSLLVSCPKSFDLCGGVQDQCVDSYTTIYADMKLHGILTRKQVKKAIMTSLYGSTATPESTFGENIDLFYDTMKKLAPGAWSLNEGLQELWDDIVGSSYDWVLPDNFHACIETKDKMDIEFKFLDETHKVGQKIDARPDFHKGLGPNVIHSVDGMVVREMFRRCMHNPQTVERVKQAILNGFNGVSGKSAVMVQTLWDHYKETGFLSVRILDHLYADTLGLVDERIIWDLIDTLPAKPFELISVHDCFRCHPNYGNDLRRQYNTIMADINDSYLMADLVKQVSHSGNKTKKLGTISRDLILNANYMLA